MLFFDFIFFKLDLAVLYLNWFSPKYTSIYPLVVFDWIIILAEARDSCSCSVSLFFSLFFFIFFPFSFLMSGIVLYCYRVCKILQATCKKVPIKTCLIYAFVLNCDRSYYNTDQNHDVLYLSRAVIRLRNA